MKYTLYLLKGDCHFTSTKEYNVGVKSLTIGIVLWIMKSLLFIAGTSVFVDSECAWQKESEHWIAGYKKM